MGPWYGCGLGGWMWMFPVVGLCIMLLFLFLLFRTFSGAPPRNRSFPPCACPDAGAEPRPESALEVLKRRYAAGEIGKDEFERMKTGIQ